MAFKETEAAWVLPFTMRDQMVIDAMDHDTRAAVERYCASQRIDSAAELGDLVFDELSDEVGRAVRRVIRGMRAGR